MQLGARHHILYVGLWTLNAARAEDMGGVGFSWEVVEDMGEANVAFSKKVVEVRFLGNGLSFRYPPRLPGANLHPESSIISKCKCRCRR